MAGTEDPANVLEQWIHDNANLPAEITHLYEEAQAKEQEIQDCRNLIAQRDNVLQKFVKLNGNVPNPKEEAYYAVIRQNYERAQQLQAEKIELIEKAMKLMDRNVKKLDRKLDELQKDGTIPMDPQLPSMLKDSPGNLLALPSLASTPGTNTPLQAVSGNQGPGGPNIASRASNLVRTGTGQLPTVIGLPQQAMQNQQRLVNAQSDPQALARQQRELSVSSDGKRRRPPGSVGPLPQPPTRAPSMGPGTPKPSTPGSRAGSVGPRQPQKQALTVKKAKPQQILRKTALTSKSGLQKTKRRKGSSRASPSTTADDESAASDAGTDEEMTGVGGADHDEETDDTKYCFCQQISFGDMVACDNDECKYQWFHWNCVGIKEEPVGDWLCPDCREKPTNKIKKAVR